MIARPEVIHTDPNIMSGTPVFIGTRVPAQSLSAPEPGGRMRRLIYLVPLLAALACKDATSARTWSVTWSAAVEGGTGVIDSVAWREHTSPYSQIGPMVTWNWTAPLAAGKQVFLRVRGTTTNPALIRTRINATSSGQTPFGTDITCSGPDTYCQIGPFTLP